jgi:hypothetical protein
LSLVSKLKPHVAALKVHKPITEMNATERRLNFMTAIILNKTLSKEEKDKRLRKIVAESQMEKALKDRGVKL